MMVHRLDMLGVADAADRVNRGRPWIPAPGCVIRRGCEHRVLHHTGDLAGPSARCSASLRPSGEAMVMPDNRHSFRQVVMLPAMELKRACRATATSEPSTSAPPMTPTPRGRRSRDRVQLGRDVRRMSPGSRRFDQARELDDIVATLAGRTSRSPAGPFSARRADRRIRPVRHRDEVGTTRPGYLVIYHGLITSRVHRFVDASTVRQHIHAIKAHSQVPHLEDELRHGLPSGLRRIHPTVVMLHYSLLPRRYSLSKRLRDSVRSCDAFRRRLPGRVLLLPEPIERQRGRIDLIYGHVHPGDPRCLGRHTPRARAMCDYPGYVDSAIVRRQPVRPAPTAIVDIDVGSTDARSSVHGSGSLEKVEMASGRGVAAPRHCMWTSTPAAGPDLRQRVVSVPRPLPAVLGVESGRSYLDLDDEV